MNYVFMTDASCDLTQELVNEIGVEVLPMEFHMEDKSYLHRHFNRFERNIQHLYDGC